MIILITFLHVAITAGFLAPSSYFLWNEMDENGILEWWMNFRDWYWPIKDGRMSFMGAVTGQCPTCMNMWLTGIFWLILAYFINLICPDIHGVYRCILAIPVMMFSNIFLQIMLKKI